MRRDSGHAIGINPSGGEIGPEQPGGQSKRKQDQQGPDQPGAEAHRRMAANPPAQHADCRREICNARKRLALIDPGH